MTFPADGYNEYIIDFYKTSKSSNSNGGQAPVLWTYLLQLSTCRFFQPGLVIINHNMSVFKQSKN